MIQISNTTTNADSVFLIADDNEDNRYTLKQRLLREGYCNIVEANDGNEAMEALKTQEIDLVLLDVLMPRKNHYQVL